MKLQIEIFIKMQNGVWCPLNLIIWILNSVYKALANEKIEINEKILSMLI